MMVAGGVGGAVVDCEDLQVGIVLVEKRVEGGGDVGGLVAGGDDDGDGRTAGGGQVVLRVAEIGDAGQASGCGDGLPEPRERDEPRCGCEGELKGVGQCG